MNMADTGVLVLRHSFFLDKWSAWLRHLLEGNAAPAEFEEAATAILEHAQVVHALALERSRSLAPPREHALGTP